MQTLSTNPAFVAYAIMLIVLSLNMLVLWAYSGAARGKTKTTPNPEDAGSSATEVVAADPPEVARVLRAHRNAMANIVPFALLAFVYVLAGASARSAIIVFAAFTVARIAHSFIYVGAKQPWRTVSFSAGAVATLALIVMLVRTLIVTA